MRCCHFSRYRTLVEPKLNQMKLILTCLSFLLFVVAAGAQTGMDRKDWNLKGKVKTLKWQDSYRSKKSGVWGEWGHSASRTFEFTAGGNITEFQEFLAYGGLSYKTVYVYNVSEKKIESSHFGGDLKLTATTTIILNDRRQKIEQLTYATDGKLNSRVTYDFDDKGNNIKSITYKADGSLSNTHTSMYDSKGNMTGSKLETPGYPTSSMKFVYDDKGMLIEEILYDKDGVAKFRYERSYDEKGNITTEIKYKGKEMLELTGWRYEYDKRGNWIKKTKLDVDRMDFHVQERTIVYY